MNVPSPCINVCLLDERAGRCTGCLRTLAEIGAWSQLDDAGKRAIWTQLKLRRRAAAALDAPSAKPSASDL